MASDDIKALAKEIASALREGRDAGGSGAYAGQPAQNVVLMIQDRQTGKTIPYSIDREIVYRKPLARLLLTTSAATLYTANDQIRNGMLVIANVSSASRTFNLYHVPSGGSASTTNALNITTTLAVGQSAYWCGLGMKLGDFFQGLCSSNSTVTMALYGEVLERNLR